MNLASAAQKRKIYSLAKDYGMDKDLLHAYIEALVHKDSVRKLTVAEATRVIDGLTGKDVRSVNPKQEGMSYAQKRYLASLAIRLGWTEEDGSLNEKRLNGFCRSQYSTLYWTGLTRSKASKAIEALKTMVEREESA